MKDGWVARDISRSLCSCSSSSSIDLALAVRCDYEEIIWCFKARSGNNFKCNNPRFIFGKKQCGVQNSLSAKYPENGNDSFLHLNEKILQRQRETSKIEEDCKTIFNPL